MLTKDNPRPAPFPASEVDMFVHLFQEQQHQTTQQFQLLAEKIGAADLNLNNTFPSYLNFKEEQAKLSEQKKEGIDNMHLITFTKQHAVASATTQQLVPLMESFGLPPPVAIFGSAAPSYPPGLQLYPSQQQPAACFHCKQFSHFKRQCPYLKFSID
uniref:CCHC-type domain-containing protein n=1 Tax=Plectus sambesii TaxID=2011161 RepID=A0A914XB58_9BILA